MHGGIFDGIQQYTLPNMTLAYAVPSGTSHDGELVASPPYLPGRGDGLPPHYPGGSGYPHISGGRGCLHHFSGDCGGLPHYPGGSGCLPHSFLVEVLVSNTFPWKWWFPPHFRDGSGCLPTLSWWKYWFPEHFPGESGDFSPHFHGGNGDLPHAFLVKVVVPHFLGGRGVTTPVHCTGGAL